MTISAEEMAKKRALFRETFDRRAAEAAGFEALQGSSWDRRLRRALALNVRFVAYVFNRFVLGASAKARVFWGKKYLWGPPEHSTSMYFYGVLEHTAEVRLTRYLIRTLADDDVFLDIGSNFGYYALLSAEFVKSGDVCAFEPVSFVFEGLAKNAHAAGSNVRAINSAVCDRVGVLDFDQAPACRHTGSSFDEASLRVPGEPRFEFTKVKVQATSVDAFCAQNKLVPTVIKIDVEGAEHLVIEGARMTLSSGAPTVILEVLKPPNKNQNHRDAARLLQELGYRPHVLTEDGGLRCLDAAALETEFSTGVDDNLVFQKPR